MNSDQTDILSDAARQVLRLHADTAYASLVAPPTGSADARTLLSALKPDQLLNRFTSRPKQGSAMLAGLWLWHDFLEESHTISQALADANGAWWHAIMHRREGDFSNSKYWLARVGDHPIHATLAIRAEDITRSSPADKSIFRLTANGWNPTAFVDLIEQIHNDVDDPRRSMAISLQQLEWRLLFDHCTRAAAGA
jgi:hypothetical protein